MISTPRLAGHAPTRRKITGPRPEWLLKWGLLERVDRAYCDRKRAQGKRHNAVLICLARRRTDVIYAMLRDRRPYTPPSTNSPEPVLAAA